MRVACLVVLSLAIVACQKPASQDGAGQAPAGPVEEARALLAQGRLDAALAKSLEAPATDVRNVCLQGQIWAKKAESAPLPTPAPDDPATRLPEFKAEELRAVDLFERARSADPKLADAHLGLADVLAPHTIRRSEVAEAGRKSQPRKGVAPPPAAAVGAASEEGPDYTPARVLSLYREAAQLEAPRTAALEGLSRLARRLRDIDGTEWALKETINRRPEDPLPLIQYGDFQAQERKDSLAAVEYYRQALIWRSDDAATKGKVADLYIELGRQHFDKREWAAALTMFREAQKYVTSPTSPQALKVRDHLTQLDAIRQGR